MKKVSGSSLISIASTIILLTSMGGGGSFLKKLKPNSVPGGLSGSTISGSISNSLLRVPARVFFIPCKYSNLGLYVLSSNSPIVHFGVHGILF